MKRLLDFHTHQSPNPTRLYNLDTPHPLDYPFSVGIHPWKLDESWAKQLDELTPLLEHPRVFALGEIGFDRLKGPATEIQQAAFQTQADLAKYHKLLIILHCVKGFHLLQAYLKRNPDSAPIIWHGWNLKIELAQSLLTYPVYFSFGKHLLLEKSHAQQWLQKCPKDKIFFETDDSDLSIESIYAQASVLLGCSIEQLSALTHSNWKKISNKQWYE
ncbi:TatD family hydrolase [Mongoliitalea daihaiensis]|uniref:TatD family hydrolase n=1 Tax=Mongoliitalea daihaiensis TaxID=2782006 RepID=UPI001F25F864|nr:TatD family hydrolase [Mongoliitalea daihaiensis]UJP65709.1 TatD family hydrolase [Mongoliitalea daihaiensis]